MKLEINLKEKIIYESFKSHIDLGNKIMDFITEDRKDKIIYKGDPYGIDYKLMKKVIDNNIAKDGDVRNAFRKIIKETMNDPYCLIYKK